MILEDIEDLNGAWTHLTQKIAKMRRAGQFTYDSTTSKQLTEIYDNILIPMYTTYILENETLPEDLEQEYMDYIYDLILWLNKYSNN